MAVGLPLKVTYADGDVYSASDVNDTNGTVNLFTSSTLSVAAGKNAIINGGFNIWQRGTSISLAASAGTTYIADRWCTSTGANQACTVSRQATGDTTNLPSIQYALRYQRNSGQTGTAALSIISPMESVNSIPLAGKTVVFSFYARKGANFSATSSILEYLVRTGTGTDQNPFSAYTGGVTTFTGTVTLTTTWQRFTATATIPATATEIAPQFYYTPTGTAGAADYYEITGVQLELGSTATTFSRAGGTIQGELAACQRYYWRSGNIGTAYSVYGQGICFSSTLTSALIVMPVTLRTFPISVDYSNLQFSDTTNVFVPTNISINASKSNYGVVVLDGGGLTGLTQFRVYELRNNNNAAGYLGISAEL